MRFCCEHCDGREIEEVWSDSITYSTVLGLSRDGEAVYGEETTRDQIETLWFQCKGCGGVVTGVDDQPIISHAFLYAYLLSKGQI